MSYPSLKDILFTADGITDKPIKTDAESVDQELRERLEAAEAQRDQLREQLSKYGQHLSPCVNNPCKCGFEAALSQSVQAEEK